MKRAGQIVLFRFPQIDSSVGKLRPAMLVARLPGPHDDWLLCMISSQRRHYVVDFDEMIETNELDFPQSGLKVASVIRTGRLAVADGRLLIGSIGQVSAERLQRIKVRLARWLTGS